MNTKSFVVATLLLLVSSPVYAQNFSLGLDLPLVGVVDNSDNQLAMGAGLSVGLVHTGPVRIGIGFGFVGYPGRKSLWNLHDENDLIFTASVGFRVREIGGGFSAIYLNGSYMKAATAKTFPETGKVNHGFLMGLTFSSK